MVARMAGAGPGLEAGLQPSPRHTQWYTITQAGVSRVLGECVQCVHLVGAGPGEALPVPHALRVGQPAAAPDDPLLPLHNLNQLHLSIQYLQQLTNHSLVFMIQYFEKLTNQSSADLDSFPADVGGVALCAVQWQVGHAVVLLKYNIIRQAAQGWVPRSLVKVFTIIVCLLLTCSQLTSSVVQLLKGSPQLRSQWLLHEKHLMPAIF